jgi:hypothetical protein
LLCSYQGDVALPTPFCEAEVLQRQ